MKKCSVYMMLFAIASFMFACSGNQSGNQSAEADSANTVSETADNAKAAAEADSIAKADSVAAAEEAAKAEQAKKDADAEVIKKFLAAIYKQGGANDIFEDSWVHKHCTPKMQKILRDEYMYDGEPGWGSWLIGGWGAGEDMETKFTGITYDGQYFYATLIPTGYSKGSVKGRRVIRFEVNLVNGTPVINDCKWIKDFKYN